MRDFTLAKTLCCLPMTHCSPFCRDRHPLLAMTPSEGEQGCHGLRHLHCSGEKGT